MGILNLIKNLLDKQPQYPRPSGMMTQAEIDAKNPQQLQATGPNFRPGPVLAQGNAHRFVGGTLGIPNEQAIQNWAGVAGQELQGIQNPGYIAQGGYVRPQQNAAGGNFQIPPVTTTFSYPPGSYGRRMPYIKNPPIQPAQFQRELPIYIQ